MDKLGLKVAVAVIGASALVMGCDNGSSDPVTPPPPNHFLRITVVDDGQAVAVVGQGAAGDVKEHITFKTVAEGKSVKHVAFKIRLGTGAPFQGGMIGSVGDNFAATWMNIPDAAKTGFADMSGDCMAGDPAAAAPQPADGTNGFGVLLTCWTNSCPDWVAPRSAVAVDLDNVVLTYTDDTTKTYDFEDGQVPAELDLSSFNTTAGGTVFTQAVLEQ